MCAVNYTVIVFKHCNIAHSEFSFCDCACLQDVFIPLIIHYFPFVTWFGGEMHLKYSQNV
jgi:hypothetical protein